MKTWDVTDSTFKYLAANGTYMGCFIGDGTNAEDLHFPLLIEPALPPHMEDELEAMYRAEIEGWTF